MPPPVASHVCMTFAWCAHPENLGGKPLVVAAPFIGAVAWFLVREP